MQFYYIDQQQHLKTKFVETLCGEPIFNYVVKVKTEIAISVHTSEFLIRGELSPIFKLAMQMPPGVVTSCRLVVGNWNPFHCGLRDVDVETAITNFHNGLLRFNITRNWKIIYGDPDKKDGHVRLFRGSPEEADKEVRECHRLIFNRMNREGSPYSYALLDEKLMNHEKYKPTGE